MKRYALALLIPALAGCASTPDPAVVCSAEWIAPRAEQALDRIESRTAKTFRRLRKVGAAYVAGDEPSTLSLLSLRGAVRDLREELTDGPGVRDLRTVAQTCNDPDFVREQVMGLLERQGLPSAVTAFMERFGLLDALDADMPPGG